MLIFDLDGDPCLVCTGDGNGNMSFSYQDFDFDGICDNDEIYGCTDPQACNYNADATELVDCQYGLCDGNCVDVEVSGSSGGNWEVIDSNGNTVVSNLPLPSYACLDPNECYQVYLSGGEDGQSINTSGWGGHGLMFITIMVGLMVICGLVIIIMFTIIIFHSYTLFRWYCI